MSAYAELAVTTNFSFLRGASHGEELVGRAKELGLAGLGVADRNSIAGVVRAHQKAKDGRKQRKADEHYRKDARPVLNRTSWRTSGLLLVPCR